MRAKLAVGDSWFKEGGSAALTQAEAEYKDFITFFPKLPSGRSQDEGGRHLLPADGKARPRLHQRAGAEREYRR